MVGYTHVTKTYALWLLQTRVLTRLEPPVVTIMDVETRWLVVGP